MRVFRTALAVLAITLGVAGSVRAESMSDKDIVEVAASAGSFKTLIAAVQPRATLSFTPSSTLREPIGLPLYQETPFDTVLPVPTCEADCGLRVLQSFGARLSFEQLGGHPLGHKSRFSCRQEGGAFLLVIAE